MYTHTNCMVVSLGPSPSPSLTQFLTLGSSSSPSLTQFLTLGSSPSPSLTPLLFMVQKLLVWPKPTIAHLNEDTDYCSQIVSINLTDNKSSLHCKQLYSDCQNTIYVLANTWNMFYTLGKLRSQLVTLRNAIVMQHHRMFSPPVPDVQVYTSQDLPHHGNSNGIIFPGPSSLGLGVRLW